MAHNMAAILTLLVHFLFHEQTVLVQAKQEIDPIHQLRHLRNTNMKEAMLLREAHLDDSKSLERNLVQCSDVELEILFDNFAQEVSWELHDEYFNFYEWEWYNSSNSNSIVNKKFCVPPGSYNFTMYDLANDGLCCGYGQGYYQVTVDGVQIKKVGEYGFLDWTSFDVVGSPTVSPAPTNAPTPYVPSPTALPTLGPTVTCSSNEDIFGVVIQMDYSPEAISWNLTDALNNLILSSEQFPPDMYYAIVYREYCLPPGIYTYTIYSVYGYGLSDGYYDLSLNRASIVRGGFFYESEDSTFATSNTPTQAPTSEPTISCSPGESQFKLTISLGVFPYAEWNLTDSDKNIVVAGGNYTSDQRKEVVGAQVCLPEDIYTFIISYDFYGTSNGYYAISVDGNEIKNKQGDFGWEETTNFATQNASVWPTASPQPSASPTVSPQPTPLWTAPPSPSSWTSWPTPLWTSNPTPSSWTSYPTWPEPTLAPTVKCASDESTFEVDLFFDYYPNATSFHVTGPDGTVLLSGQDFSYHDWSVHKELCLPAGSYLFTIFDDNGDGMCCDNGPGLYKLSLDGVVVKKGGVFGSEESTEIVSAPPA